MKNWKAQDTSKAKNIGVFEFHDEDGEWNCFDILKTDDFLVFGGGCNVGFLESGNYEIDHDLSLDENLQELLADLESFYNDGDGYQSDRFSHNDRM